MKEKKAFVNAVFGTMEAIDGAKKVGKAYNDNTNKYDDLMGTKLVKAPKVMGNQNAMVAGKSIVPKTASEKIDYLYKEANADGAVRSVLPKIKGVIPKIKGAVDKFDAANTQHLIDAGKAFKNKEILKGLQHSISAAPGTALGAGIIAGSGIGTAKLLKKLDGRDDPRNNVEYNTIGGAISAGMALQALDKKRMLAPASKALSILAGHATKVPANVVKNTPVGKAVNIAGQGIKATATQANKMNNTVNIVGSNIDKLMDSGKSFEEAKKIFTDRQIQIVKNQNWHLGKTDPAKLQNLIDARLQELEHAFGVVQDLVNKKASVQLDEMCKVAGIKTDYLNHVVKNKFFKAGLESIPYYAGTAMIGLAVDKSNQKRMKDLELYKAHQEALKKKQSQPNKPQEKVASASPVTVFVKNPGADKVIRQSLESAVEGVGRMAIPLAASTLIGRDLTNSFRKINRKHQLADGIAPDEASIQLSRRDRKQMQKDIQDLNPAPDKVAEENNDSSDAVRDMVRDIEKDIIGADEVLQGDRVHIGNGIKKQFRMNPGHGMHGMTE